MVDQKKSWTSALKLSSLSVLSVLTVTSVLIALSTKRVVEREDSGQGTLDENQFKFSLEEYKTLRQEISERVSSEALVERYGVIALAAIYSFLLYGERVGPPVLAALPRPPAIALVALPPVFCLVCIVRRKENMQHVWLISSYLQSLEQRIYQGGHSGWESTVGMLRATGKLRPSTLHRTVTWCLLFSTTLAFGFYEGSQLYLRDLTEGYSWTFYSGLFLVGLASFAWSYRYLAGARSSRLALLPASYLDRMAKASDERLTP